jgi:hypothetical protein
MLIALEQDCVFMACWKLSAVIGLQRQVSLSQLDSI